MEEDTPNPQFPVTRWSVVLTAAGSGIEARRALEELCRLYWFPLYAFARQKGCGAEDAEDETQEFLSRVASGDLLLKADQERGKLRTFLLAMFQRDLIDTARKARRQKRGGNIPLLSLDAMEAETRLLSTPQQESPTRMFDRFWAMTCLESTMAALETEYATRGRGALFATLRTFLDPEMEGDYGEAAKALNLEANALRQAVFRLRQRFRALLRQTVADTLEMPSEALIDEELAALRQALA
jgi:DNA-directed RNA polymerase specialized sigma24 family protein